MKRSAPTESFCFFDLQGLQFRARSCLALLLLLFALPGAASAGVYIGGTPKSTLAAGTGYDFKPWAGPSGSKLTFTIKNKPAWLTFNAATGEIWGAPKAGQAGKYNNIHIGVSDGKTSAWLPVFSIDVTGSGVALALSSSSYTVAQSSGSLRVTVNRSGGTGAATVAFATVSDTAVAGKDFTAASGQLTWSSGDTSAKSFVIPVSNSAPFSGTRSFTVALSSPGGGANLSTPSSATATINGSGSSSGGSGGSVFPVYTNGVFHWQGDYSWGVTINYKDTAGSPMSGPYDISVSGIGGFQPYATNYDFDPTPYKYLVVSLKPTIPNQRWDSAFYAVGDVLTGHAVNVLNYGPAPVVGQWTTYKIPLGAGGYDIPAGTHIYKFMFIDQTADVQGSGYKTNRWYVDNLYFAKDSTSTPAAPPGSSGSGAAGGGSTGSAVSTYQVYSNGVYSWPGDMSWGGVVVNYKDSAGQPLSGAYDISIKGIGGFQPNASASGFDPSPYKYLTVALKPTLPNQKWDSAVYAVDGSLAGHAVNVLNYGPTPVVGQWNTYKIPLGSGGYEMPSGARIFKFMFIDQTADVQGSGYTTNTWYVDNLGFTTDGSSTGSTAGSGGTSGGSSGTTGGGSGSGTSGGSGGTSGGSGSGSSGNSGSGSGSSGGTGSGTSLPSGVTWMYLNGKKTLAGDFTGVGDTTDYEHSTSSGYNGGTKDILITASAPWGYFIPYWASNYRLPNPGYQYLLLSIKPSVTGDTFGIHAERVGDAGLPPIEVMNYGPPAVAGQWSSYVIPLKDLGVYGDATLYKVVLQTHTNAADSWEMDAIGFK